ncbi:MAG TPA: ABC transporter substrate-binding protein [Desulfosporosinus sp.]|nr:ABC transporter substrate-binding protein [Desulfosporosinus sp.]
MKVTSSYWLGLGSGLILSAMLTVVISPQKGQALIPQKPSSVAPVVEKEITQTHPTTQPSVSTELSQVQPPKNQSSTPIELNFIIPMGASTERIADLLIAQGLIKARKTFLAAAHQMGVEREFRAGVFNLSLGLTTEELIHRLTSLK